MILIHSTMIKKVIFMKKNIFLLPVTKFNDFNKNPHKPNYTKFIHTPAILLIIQKISYRAKNTKLKFV